jgi:hypothetical protein
MATGTIGVNGGVLNTGITKQTIKETGAVMQMPVSIGQRGQMWTLPREPLVSVRGRNIITRRNIAKKKGVGSVKELWSTDDYEVILTGTLVDAGVKDELPTQMITRLTALYQSKKSVIIECALLEAVGIGLLAIESIEFPPTKGISRQDYVIRGFSDSEYELL